jgi:hypothetical protein
VADSRLNRRGGSGGGRESPAPGLALPKIVPGDPGRRENPATLAMAPELWRARRASGPAANGVLALA